METYASKINNAKRHLSEYELNPKYNDYLYERAFNNFAPLAIQNENYNRYPWNMVDNHFSSFLRTPHEYNTVPSPIYNDIDNIENAHNLKMIKRQNIINGMDIGKVKSVYNPMLKTSQAELDKLRQKTTRVANMIKEQPELDAEKNRAFTF